MYRPQFDNGLDLVLAIVAAAGSYSMMGLPSDEKCEKCGGPIRIIVNASHRSIEKRGVAPS